MSPTEIQQLLKEGIAALRAGDKPRGRELLLRVVEADERMEPAWLWLATAVDDPNDKLVALENALALNPQNAAARAQWQALQQQLGHTPEPPPPAAPPAPVIANPTLADPNENPFQCAYCGKPTAETDETCPHCQHDLMVPGDWQETRGFRNSLTIVTGVDLQIAIVQTLGALVAMGAQIAAEQGYAQPFNFRFGEFEKILIGFFGNYPQWSEQGAGLPFGAAMTRNLMLGLLYMMVYSDMDTAFYVAIGLGVADLLWAGLGGWTGNIGSVAALINAIFALILISVGGLALISRRRARVRLKVKISKDAHGARGMYQNGKESRHRGQWALAALYFLKAIALKPSEVIFYKDAAVALAQVGRYPEALNLLEEAARRTPEDKAITKLAETITEQLKNKP